MNQLPSHPWAVAAALLATLSTTGAATAQTCDDWADSSGAFSGTNGNGITVTHSQKNVQLMYTHRF